MKSFLRGVSLALLLFALVTPGAEAQVYSSFGLGLASPVGDLGDTHDVGITTRGQVGLSLLIADVHLQTGWTSFSASGDSPAEKDFSTFHAGAGARVGLGFIWIGANAAYFFGDGEEGVGFLPEAGLRIWHLEGVVDFRVDGDEKWGSARLSYRF